jgi:hypothetical protein
MSFLAPFNFLVLQDECLLRSSLRNLTILQQGVIVGYLVPLLQEIVKLDIDVLFEFKCGLVLLSLRSLCMCLE